MKPQELLMERLDFTYPGMEKAGKLLASGD